jgi:DNA-binding response OmpR family regulator
MPPDAGGPSARRSRETVLVVEDDPAIRAGLEMNLRAEGYRVLATADGGEGLSLARAEHPDLILLDLMLPRRPGLDVLKSLRGEGLEMQVLLVTALGEEEDIVRGLALGADDYIVKPFGLRELMARIEAALRRPRQSTERVGRATVKLAAVVLDLEAREARRGERPLRLTAKEFDLLLYFAERPDRVLSREQLLEGVWGEEYTGTGRTVDNFVRSLRTKVEDDPARPRHLVTVHGVGYRYKP